MTRELTPTAAMIEEAQRLGVDAALNDGWMQPTDEADQPESREDYGNWQQEEQDGWQSTDHFQVHYRQPLRQLCLDYAAENGIDSADEDAYAVIGDLMDDLMEEFWEAWHENRNTYGHWLKNVATPGAS